MTVTKLAPRDRDIIMQALAAGVVPRVGLAHLQVGRARETAAMVSDVDRVADGGSAVRFVIGEYGAGKTFFLNLVRLVAMERKCVTVHADLSPERRLHANEGQARALYAEAVKNMATRTKPEGGALQAVVEKFVTSCMVQSDSPSTDKQIERRLAAMYEFSGGFDFVEAVKLYAKGVENGDDVAKVNALRWIRGEFPNKTEARAATGIKATVDASGIYDALKLLSVFVRAAGYAGMFVVFDEMVNIYKLQHPQARSKNHEQILTIVNDLLQGHVAGMAVVFGGTPEFLTDTRRGLYSYEALQSRLSENAFAINGAVDFSGPVIRLQKLTQEELFLLLSKVSAVFASDGKHNGVGSETVKAFMAHCFRKVGESYFRTPRNTVKAFAQFLAVLDQNPGINPSSLLSGVEIARDDGAKADMVSEEDDEDLASVRL